ncbi:transcriptional regulator, TetR family [Mycobacterium intracellulare subsp. yongonense]|nr:transcriptional regulator, TetR family [Mycobacterium intracellulare subsp. yongonense]ARR82914.1 TetR family transcriptional regulator [Mycobacterium intracellulare subsp. yongonense]
MDAERVIEVKRISTAATLSPADAIGSSLPALGRSGSLDMLLAAHSRRPRCGRSPTGQSASPMPMPRSRKWFPPSGIWTSHPPSPAC